ncbi:cadherin-17 [Tachyglossus aculeatus]|uniref:cadherin-17 n=1 Tax=Tachyglossus aculeatus TaxID=9261 RepID=UPI0018F578DF|nr:cadherin-17 [Tachyglossus aculeatus]
MQNQGQDDPWESALIPGEDNGEKKRTPFPLRVWGALWQFQQPNLYVVSGKDVGKDLDKFGSRLHLGARVISAVELESVPPQTWTWRWPGFSPFQTIGYSEDINFSGPLKPMNFTIPEGTSERGIFQFKANPPAQTVMLTGETDGIIHIKAENGWLYLNGTLDWEKRSAHRLQVAGLDASGKTVEGPYPVIIIVKDINDNQPIFTEESYHGSVRENSRPGRPFMYVNATDQDDPSTPNAQLFYRILAQLPSPGGEVYFQVHNQTGGISVTQEGSKALDIKKNNKYQLVVMVTDMGGQGENAFSTSTNVFITINENIWKSPDPISIAENSTEPHPFKITQVMWNDLGAHYELINKEKLPRFPFSVDQNGSIYATQPLDREEKESYVFYVAALDETKKPLARPLEILVEVTDINDNPPVCASAVTIFEVQENERIGSNIGVLEASDADKEGSANSFLSYRILEQIPDKHVFLLQSHTGLFQLSQSSLRKQDAPQYSVTVEVSDSVFKTKCAVQINIIDINDQIPIFEQSDYGSQLIDEDAPVGTTILTIQARDADEPFTGSSKIIYKIIQGDPNNTLEVETDPQTNAGYVKIKKPLDFETLPSYNLVFRAENPEPLVLGVDYNSSSSATFKLFVRDVNEAPVFSQPIYQVQISEGVPQETNVTTVTAKDPEGQHIRYSLKGDVRNWLKIDPYTGEIFTAAQLDREAEQNYKLQVVATEQGGSGLSSSVLLSLSLTDVNDNPPRLIKEYKDFFFCYPLQNPGSLIFEATDDDKQSYRGPQFTFSLGDDTSQKDWEVTKINGTHAKLSTKHTNFEEKAYMVSVKINDGGKPPLEGTSSFPVNMCSCVDERCYMPVERQPGRPTVGMAVGILLATLLVIGIILTVVFVRLRKKGNANLGNATRAEVTPLK